MITKKWYQSKLVWIGILQVVAAVIEFITNQPDGVAIGVLISGILTIILRAYSSGTAIAGTPGARVKK
jgi:hypothetical protein